MCSSDLTYLAAKLLRFIPYAMSGALLVAGTGYGVNRGIYYESARDNKEAIEVYNADVERYAEYIRSLDLTQTETIVKVMADIYAQYKYKFPQEEIFGYARLSLYENGYGVCRNMSDDFCAKLNAIDPSFNAHNLVCQINSHDTNGEPIPYDIMDNIPRTIDVVDEEDVLTNSTSWGVEQIGNHMVSVVTLKGETVPLIVDPTNPGMGAIYNGEIYMFNAPENAIVSKPISTFFVTERPLSVVTDYFESIENIRSFNELRQRYCPDVLEEALERVRAKEAEISVEIETDDFSERYRVTTDSQNQRPSRQIKRDGEQRDIER